ncbi:unnamed protein product, partial [marine sediment metagenome]
AKRGGGILNSAKLLHNTSENSLYEQALKRINEIIGLGTGAVEIKSGYGSLETGDCGLPPTGDWVLDTGFSLPTLTGPACPVK